MEQKRSDEDLVAFAKPRALLEMDLDTGDTRILLDDEKPLGERRRLMRFVITSRDERAAVGVGEYLDSAADLLVPSCDVDSDELYEIGLRFYIGKRLTGVISGDGNIPRGDVLMLALRIAREVQSEAVQSKALDQLSDFGKDARYVVLRVLQQRVRDIEKSVREALNDEHVSSEDYAALREYPARLARVERLASTLPEPKWVSARPRDSSLFQASDVDLLGQWIRDVAGEASEAVARLSGLIASQSVVVAQRQAAEAERFQRLLTLVGTTVLVPGLVAAVFGANVDVPGKDSLDGFYAMLCFMVASAAASYALLRSFQQDLWSRLGRRLSLGRSREPSEHGHLLAFVAVAVIAAVWGVVVLLWD